MHQFAYPYITWLQIFEDYTQNVETLIILYMEGPQAFKSVVEVSVEWSLKWKLLSSFELELFCKRSKLFTATLS